MFNDIIRTYADAMYVATTLRLPQQAPPARESDRIADREERRRAPLADRLVGWLARWLRRGSAAVPTAAIHTPRG
jgi:hypothetical protein